MMFRLFLVFCSLPLFTTCQTPTPKIQIIPQPVSVEAEPGVFTIMSDTRIYIPKLNEEWATAAAYLVESLAPAMGFRLTVDFAGPNASQEAVPAIYFVPDPQVSQREGYILEVKPNAIFVRARNGAGGFYAVQSLRQLFAPEIFSGQTVAQAAPWTVPCCRIVDEPRFSYRGLHLDVGRHYFPPAFIKKYIDLLAAHKLNTFHWHLTEDQGWRIEIKKYPLLQSEKARRKETLIGHYSDTPQRFDGTPDVGYYTQEEVRDIVAYAEKRFVTIIPEIEMPGHSLAALSAYPQLGCVGGPYEPARLWGVFDDVYCAGNDATFAFIEGVLEEVCALFPGKYVHIGGDECPKTRWEACPKCQRRMAAEKLENAHELQSYFIRRAEAILAKFNKKLIGWDEILEGGLAPSATVMSWRGIDGGIAAAKAGHDAIMTPGSHLYLDHYQSDPMTEPLAIGGFLPLEKVYSYEPVPEELNVVEAKHILGAQGNVWTEYMTSTEQVEYMAYPRVCALAEVTWTPAAQKSWPDFSARLLTHFKRLDAYGVNYAKSFFDVSASFSNGKVSLQATLPDAEIRYTTNGSEPTVRSKRFRRPFPLRKTTVVKAVLIYDKKPAGKVRSVPYFVHKASGKPYTMPRVPDKYKGGEQYGLTNGIVGNIKGWNNWVGLVNHDIDPVIDLGKSTGFKQVSAHFVNSKASWIYPPRAVEVFSSDDGQHFKSLGKKSIDAESMTGSTVETVVLETPGAKGRYLKFVATTFGTIPDGAPGAGEGAWLFIDEVIVE